MSGTVSSAMLPLQGLLYIVRHRVFPLQSSIKPVALNAAGSLAFLLLLYTRGWSLQAPIVYGALGAGPVGTAALQVVLAAEACATLYALLRRTLSSASTSMFDAVLAHRGVTSIQKFPPAELEDIRRAASAEQQRQQRLVRQRGVLARLLRFALRQVGQRVLTAPLMLIPGFGWAAYLYVNAASEGAACHRSFFKRKGATDDNLQKVIVQSRSQQYNAFGSTALLMNLIPVLNYVLNLGCAAGAALWAADVELSGERWLQQKGAPAKQE